MGDCEHGKLAVTTSENFLKKKLKNIPKQKSRDRKKKSRSIKKNSQIPTQYRNVTFNFQGTDFVTKAVRIPLLTPPPFQPFKTPQIPLALDPPIPLIPPKYCTCFLPSREWPSRN